MNTGAESLSPVAASLALCLALFGSDPDPSEAHVTIDVKEAEAADVVRVLAEAAGFQAVLDPGISCRLSLKLRTVRWPKALESTLRSCRLGAEQQGKVLRVASLSRLRAEAAARRRLEEARRVSSEPSFTSYRLSYARAEELAPVLARLLGPGGEVTYDSRTNTLIILR
jgi:type IV pilus assembly protein PilQ